MAASESEQSYAGYRRALLDASVPGTAWVVLGVTALYQASVALGAPQRFANEWLPNLIQLLVPVAVWILHRGPLAARPAGLLQGAELAYSATLIARLMLPATSVSGTALYLAVKMLATALFIPWGVRIQAVSVAFTLVFFYVLTIALGLLGKGAGDSSHQWVGPLIAGLMSIAGAAAADRVRRSVFERERQLQASAAHLQSEAEIEETLARVGRELIALPDTARILDRLCHLTTEAVHCDASHTFLWDAEREEYLVAAGYGDRTEEWQALRLVSYPKALVEPLQRRLDETDTVEFLVADAPPQPLAMLRQLGTTRILAVALRRGDRLVGVQSCEYRGRTEAFSARDMRIMRGMAQLGSLALETARLFEELDAANRLKSEFVATMSHELRSPLNIIIGYHELLLEGGAGPLSEPQRDPLRRADRSARELLDLISATLDLSRLEARRIALDLSAVDVAELVDEVGREYAADPDRPALALRWFTAAGLPPLRTDRVKLKMVLKNLVGNAVKFTERGQVSLTAGGAADGGADFVVSDTGPGIPAEAQAVIFEPFRQLDVPRSRLREGAGLGLYIVKRLLDALGGTVALESTVGEGSTFRVHIPPAADPAAA